jgi:hypothetical protein
MHTHTHMHSLSPRCTLLLQGVLSARADMFALGVMLWEFATGHMCYRLVRGTNAQDGTLTRLAFG